MSEQIRPVIIRHWNARGKPRYHRGYRTDLGVLVTAEADNLDQAGRRDELAELPDDVADAELCRRCFGDER